MTLIHRFKSGTFPFLFSVVVAITLLITACQPNSTSISHPSTSSDTVIRLTLWHGINPPANREVFDRLVDRFNHNHPNIHVQSIFAGDLDQQLPKILTAVIGNIPPDLLVFYPQMTGQFVELGAIHPLENWLDQQPVKKELFLNLLDELTLDGHLWSVPLYTSNVGIFYRPDLFQAAGIQELPKTWDTFREVAKQLTHDRNGDGKPEQFGILLPLGKGEWTVLSWFPFLLSAGGQVVTHDVPNLTHPGAITALRFWQDLIQDGSALLSAPERGYEEDAFLTGRVAMQITGPWTYIAKSDQPYGVFPIPVQSQPATVTGSGNLYLMTDDPQRQAAAHIFLAEVLSESFQTEWSMGTGFLPVNRLSAESKAYVQFMQQKPMLQTFIAQIPVARPRPILAGYSRLSDALGRAIETVVMQKASPEEALLSAQQRLDLMPPVTRHQQPGG
ncbi:MAG: ABC transporter substrate-binding protein [Cyanobacteria bacterium WB6_1B_304]|nr:ABC transporter substrate-binding protein [Cyanobacteria bacterium WB6_1B_304]